MVFHQMNCPNCNASLEIEDGIDTFFCKYCGAKIIVTGQSDAVLQAKADIRKAEIEKEIREKEMEHERQMAELEKKDNHIWTLLSLAAIAILLLFGSCGINGL